MPVPKRDPHSGALIFHREPHEIEADDQREQLRNMQSEIDELKSLVLSMTRAKEDDR